MSSTYRKTDKGLAEIQTRALRLSPRLRGALIVMDGHRSTDDLRALITDFDETVRTLLQHGLVEQATPRRRTRSTPRALPTQRVGVTLREPLEATLAPEAAIDTYPSAPPLRRRTAEPPPEPTPAVSATAWLDIPTRPMPPEEPPPAKAEPARRTVDPSFDINTFRREAARALMEQTDVEGEVLAAQLLRAREPEELQTLLEVAAQLLAGKRGREAAQAYRARFTMP